MLHSKQWSSRTAILHEEVLQDSSAPIPAPILQGYPYNVQAPYTIHIFTCTSREFSIQNTILHAEDKELFEYYITVSRNSTHRRQGDLLEMHPCVLQDLPMTFQAFQPQDLPRHSSYSRDIPDIPVIHDLPAFPGNSTNSTMFQ